MPIYFIQCGTNGPIKIGYTNKDVKERITQLQTACPYELNLLWIYDQDYDVEQNMHELLKHENIRGEWFRPGKDVFREIEDCSNEYIVNMYNNSDLCIYENYDKTIFMDTPIGEFRIDLKNNSIDINPRVDGLKVTAHNRGLI